jgi:hypothetical protein
LRRSFLCSCRSGVATLVRFLSLSGASSACIISDPPPGKPCSNAKSLVVASYIFP